MTLSMAQMVVVLILAVSSFLAGWMLRRIQAKSREAQLQKHLTDANTAIPSLETNLRNRDQRIASLFGELTEWKAKTPSLEAAVKRGDADLLAKERELRTARVEIDALKVTLAAAPIPSFIALPVAPATESEAALLARIEMLESNVAARDARIAERDVHVAELQTRLDSELETMRSVRTELAGRAAEIERVQAEGAKWQARVPKLVATIKARDATLAERDAQSHQSAARAAEMSAQLEAAAAHHAAKLATALRLGREELDAHQAGLERLQADRDAQSARSRALEGELAALQAQLHEKTQAAAAEAQGHAATEADLRGQISGFEQTIAQMRQLAHEQQSAHEQQLLRASDQHAQRMSVEQQRHEAAVANATKLEAARAGLESRLATARRTHGELEQQIAALDRERESTEQRLQNAEREANERVAEDMEQQTIELVELRDEVRTLHTRIAPLESLLKQRDSALFERGERIEAMTTQIQALVAQTESLQAALRQRGEKIATLERKFSDQPPPPAPSSEPADRRGDHLEQRLVAQIERNRELTGIVEERDRDLASAAKSNELNGKSMLVLKHQLDDARQTEERLAAQVRELKAASQRAPEPESATVRPAMTKPNGLFELPPEHVDELQQIRGIGDGFERGLNKLGIYQFSQLAGLSSVEIVWIEAHLPTFHGRIERDDWPGQAAALMTASEHAEWSLRARSAPGPGLSPRLN